MNNLLELLGFALIAGFAWFVWPPLVLLVAGLLLVLWANVRPARARRKAQAEAPNLRPVA